MGYINTNYQQYGVQTAPQFAGIPTPQTTQIPPQESSLAEEIFNPFGLLFLPMTVMDPNVKKYIKSASETNGVKISADPNKSIFGFKYKPTYTDIKDAPKAPSMVEQLKATDYKGIWKQSVVDPRREVLYKSLAKEIATTPDELKALETAQKAAQSAKTPDAVKAAQTQVKAAQEAISTRKAGEIAGRLGNGHEAGKISEVIREVKDGKKFMNGIREAMGVGKVAKFFRSVPVLSTALFSIGEVFEIGSATKYGAGETAKQVVRSTANVAANVVSFEAGTALGASIGATLGSVVPGAGTLIGGIVGGFLGGIVSSHVAGKVTNGIFDAVLGKPKHKIAAEQEAAQAQTEAQTAYSPVAQAVQPSAFGAYSNQQAFTPAFASGTINLGQDDASAMNAYYRASMVA